MTRIRVSRITMLVLAIVAVGCQDSRPSLPTAATLFTPSIQGVWSGQMTLLATSGGECVGAVVPTFLPSRDSGTITVSQDGGTLQATLTMESTGLACKYSGNATASNLAMNATSCDRTGLVISCIDGQARELELVGSSVTGTWSAGEIAGQTTSTYNVFARINNQKVGVGSLVATHSFDATRR